MARLIPLYSASSQAEIEKRAQRLFQQNGLHSGHELHCWLQAEADYLEQMRRSPKPTYHATAAGHPPRHQQAPVS